jgi:glyoxylase-like metal-dependent hydrolase (beta-lactamase superfamily II)
VTGWDEVGDGVLRRRYEPWDVNVCVVRAADGLLVVDTRASARQGAELAADLEVFGSPVRWVVNTHAHFDHTFGNQLFATGQPPAAIYGHARVPAHLERYEVPMLAAWQDRTDVSTEEWRDIVITPPTELVEAHAVLDLGDRAVELVHLGRGHTDNDLLVHVRDADTWLVGDLVEESGPPMYGSGSHPLEWPATVAALLARLGEDSRVVPGHGTTVDAAFVTEQQTQLEEVAALVRELHADGVPLAEAVEAGGERWPFPADGMANAVADGYSHLALEP